MSVNDNTLSKHIYAGELKASTSFSLPDFNEMDKWELFSTANQVKLKLEFAEAFANNRLEMTNAAFFILDKITIFTDVDFSIAVKMDEFQRFIKMNHRTFKRSINYLLNRGYLKWNETYQRYFLTAKTHILVENQDISSLANKDSYYIPTINISNWSEFNNELTAKEQRFLFHLIVRSAFYNNKYTLLLNSLLHNRSRHVNNKQFTEMEDAPSILAAFEKFHKLGLFEVQLYFKEGQPIWLSEGNINRDFPEIKSSILIVELKCNYKDTALDNVNNYYTVEKALRSNMYYLNSDLLAFPFIAEKFKTFGRLDNSIELNTLIKLKKILVFSVDESNRSDIISLFNLALQEFIRDNFYRLHLLANEEFAVVNAFKDFYFIPKLDKLIIDSLPIIIRDIKHDINNGLVVSPEFKMAFSKKNFNSLLAFYSTKANAIALINFNHAIKERVACFAKHLDHANFLMDEMKKIFPGFNQIAKKCNEKLYDRFVQAVVKYEMNISFDAFANVTSYITHTLKRFDDTLMLKLIDKTENFLVETKQAELATKQALTHKNIMFNKAKKYPYQILTNLVKSGVSKEFIDTADMYIKPYYEGLINCVSFVYRDVNGNQEPHVARNKNIDSIDSLHAPHQELAFKKMMGIQLSDHEKVILQNGLLDSELIANPNSPFIVLDMQIDEEKIVNLQRTLKNQLIALVQADRLRIDKQTLYQGNSFDEEIISFETYFNIDKKLIYNGGFNQLYKEEYLEGRLDPTSEQDFAIHIF